MDNNIDVKRQLLQLESFLNDASPMLFDDHKSYLMDLKNRLANYVDSRQVRSKYGTHFTYCPWSSDDARCGPDTCGCLSLKLACANSCQFINDFHSKQRTMWARVAAELKQPTAAPSSRLKGDVALDNDGAEAGGRNNEAADNVPSNVDGGGAATGPATSAAAAARRPRSSSSAVSLTPPTLSSTPTSSSSSSSSLSSGEGRTPSPMPRRLRRFRLRSAGRDRLRILPTIFPNAESSDAEAADDEGERDEGDGRRSTSLAA